MAISRRRELFHSPSLFSRLQTLASELQRWKHTSAGGGKVAPLQDACSEFSQEGSCDSSNWKTVDSRSFGIRNSAVSFPTWKVLEILQRKGFEAYLVGGCVRDLILRKVPKDFDVVTTATLEQIGDQFKRCRVIGRRFPICHVYISGSIIEVSSFKTVPKVAKKRETIKLFQIPKSCDKKDLVRWKDSMRRDFTINGLFFDPFAHKIYDYVDGIDDLKASKVRTIIPAYLSFKEDCARILRGLRIAARLGLRFSRDTAASLQDFSSSIMTLTKERLMMELNFMLAYGAAESSICLLQKYRLLGIFLPFHAAYLSGQSKNQSDGSSIMLLKLLSHADKLLAADRPCSCRLWLGLLAFHLTLVNHPQSALVIRTFSSILWLGAWEKAVKFARENDDSHVQFVPEILTVSGYQSDESILKETCHFASLVKCSLNNFTSSKVLQESLARCRMPSPSSDFDVFVSKKMGRDVAKLFDIFVSDMKSYVKERKNLDVNYELLKRGDAYETRFVLGKVIFDTMNSELIHQQDQKSIEGTGSGVDICQKNQTSAAVEKVHQKSVEGTLDVHQTYQTLVAVEKVNRPLSAMFSF